MVKGDCKNIEAYLMDNTRAWLPEANTILSAGRGKKIVDFFVQVLGAGKIGRCPILGLDQMVAVDGGRHMDAWQTAADELHHGHLRDGQRHPPPADRRTCQTEISDA